MKYIFWYYLCKFKVHLTLPSLGMPWIWIARIFPLMSNLKMIFQVMNRNDVCIIRLSGRWQTPKFRPWNCIFMDAPCSAGAQETIWKVFLSCKKSLILKVCHKGLITMKQLIKDNSSRAYSFILSPSYLVIQCLHLETQQFVCSPIK